MWKMSSLQEKKDAKKSKQETKSELQLNNQSCKKVNNCKLINTILGCPHEDDKEWNLKLK